MAVPLTHQPTGNRRRTYLVIGAAALTALALVVFMVTSVTRAAWTAQTDNTGSSWDTGTVSLTDDDGGSAMFEITNMMAGDVETNSIMVTNASSVPLDVRMYGANVTGDSALAGELSLDIGTTSGGTDVYTGTLAGFATSHTNFDSGTSSISLGTDVGTNDTQEYHFTVRLPSDAPTTVQNMTAGIDFVWEGQTQ